MLLYTRIMSLGKKLKSFFWSKRFLKHFVILIIVYVVIIGGTVLYLKWYTNHGDKVTVPNLIGKNVKNIGTSLEDVGLQYEVLDSIYEPTKVEGTILSQDPMATDSTSVFVKEGRVVRVRVSKRTQLVEMPECVDKSQRFAENILRNRGLKYHVEYRTTTEADGAVMQQLYQVKSIAGKSRVPIGSTIKLVVGRNLGGAAVPVPNLQGLTICEAKERLSGIANINLVLVCDGCITVADSCSAIVDVQNPEYMEGAYAPAGSSITVFAKKGGSRLE